MSLVRGQNTSITYWSHVVPLRVRPCHLRYGIGSKLKMRKTKFFKSFSEGILNTCMFLIHVYSFVGFVMVTSWSIVIFRVAFSMAFKHSKGVELMAQMRHQITVRIKNQNSSNGLRCEKTFQLHNPPDTPSSRFHQVLQQIS